MNDMILTEEQRAIQQLAYYDARGVREEDLRRIFNCTSAQLGEVRKEAYYREILAVETNALTERETSLDDSWDVLEGKALGALNETIDSIGDPRLMLAAAKHANSAARRRLGGRSPGNAGSAVINVDELTSNSKVVRLRTRFLERIQTDGQIDRMVERETEVRTQNSGDMREDMSPTEVRDLLESALGVDTANLRAKRHQGPDLLPGIEIDFGNLG